MVREQSQSDRHGRMTVVTEPGDEDQVPLRLRHLLPAQSDHAGVHEVSGEGAVAGEQVSLGGPHLVVREDQVTASALHVETVAQMVQRDGGALDVPSRAAVTEVGVPRRLAGPFRLPQQWVEGILLAGAGRVSPALGEQFEHPFAGEGADETELLVAGDRVVDVSVEVVGSTGLEQLVDPLHHERDRLDRADVVTRRQDAERGHVLAEQCGLGSSELAPVLAGRDGAFEQRVVDVGDVLHVVHVVTGVQPDPLHEVERDVRRGVPEMCGVVGGDPADVQAGGRAGLGGTKRAGRGVVENERRAGAGQRGQRWLRPGLHDG